MDVTAVESTTLAIVGYDDAQELLQLEFRSGAIYREAVLQEILEERVSSSRNRINPRGVKRKMSNYSLRPRQTGPDSPDQLQCTSEAC